MNDSGGRLSNMVVTSERTDGRYMTKSYII